MTTTQDVIKAAMSVAGDAAEGRLDPADLDAELVATCRELVGTVAGPDDTLWSLHLDIARQVLAMGGVTLDELSEWAAVLRQRAGEPPNGPDLSDMPAVADSAASEPYSPKTGGPSLPSKRRTRREHVRAPAQYRHR
ncbi:hypothetical protein AWB90_18290 [Mycobacterium paraense]|uniref:Flagellar hook-length control protein n=1 Tax=Mycobacterium paraense TaxID=767916 RepID=A0A1X2A7B2_9MYCO|nr:hypothetical protein [Mycobacterium paraense]ORW43103.1 hypothetical protein AWB90_18290 [Mycobacterium paraense]